MKKSNTLKKVVSYLLLLVMVMGIAAPVMAEVGDLNTKKVTLKGTDENVKELINQSEIDELNRTDYKIGDELKLIDPTTKNTKYVFKGWFKNLKDENTKIENPYTLQESDFDINGETTIFAKWEKITHKVTLQLDGGNIDGKTDDIVLNVDTETKVINNKDYKVPVKDESIFKYWYVENENEPFDKPIVKDEVLKAKWAKTHKVTLELKGGNIGGSTNTKILNVETGTKVTDAIDYKEPVRDDFAFKYWYLTDENKEFDDKIMDEKTLNAKWMKQVTVTFNTDGGSSINPIKMDVDTLIKEPAKPTKANRDFDGWYKEAALKTKWDFGKDTVTDTNTTLYAKWVAKGTGGSGSEDDKKDYVTVSIIDDAGKYLIRRERIEIKRNSEVIDATEDALRDNKDIRRDFEIKDKKLIAVQKLANNKDSEWVLKFNKKDEGTKGGNIKLRHDDTIEWEFKKIKAADKDKDKGKDEDKKPETKPTPKPSSNGMLNTSFDAPYMEGYPNGKFDPEKEVTREEVAQALYRLLDPATRDNNITNSHNYKDVNSGRWSERSIATLAKLDVLKGYNDGTFKPSRGIKRAEVATMLARMTDLNGSSNTSFNDVAGHWAAADINAVSKKGWISGYPNGTFRPDKNITRAELVKMVNSALGRTGSTSGLINNFNDIKTGQWYYNDVLNASNDM